MYNKEKTNKLNTKSQQCKFKTEIVKLIVVDYVFRITKNEF